MYHEVVLAGVAISLLFSELTGLSPAGLVVPGYIALALQTPRRVAYTLLIALLAWGVAKVLSRWMILYGRRRFAVLILLSFLLNEGIIASGLLPYDPGMIGVLVPGIMANEVEKQGLAKSLLSLGVVVGILVLLMMWKGMRVFPL
ncbi:MAG: poly-gamma-glutamate biosynthesis protein PgsC [Oscillibacter sp.]|nr:poly-gamma-glutamate biosynthesis protein PgsC [Oscillibacter sp.]